MKAITVVAEKDLILTQAMLHEAGLRGRLRLLIHPGEIRILPASTADAEEIVRELVGCLGHEPATAYDFHLKFGGLYEAR